MQRKKFRKWKLFLFFISANQHIFFKKKKGIFYGNKLKELQYKRIQLLKEKKWKVFSIGQLFDFLGKDMPRCEVKIERKLTEHIQNFLLELESGVDYVGRQTHLKVSGDDFLLIIFTLSNIN